MIFAQYALWCSGTTHHPGQSIRHLLWGSEQSLGRCRSNPHPPPHQWHGARSPRLPSPVTICAPTWRGKGKAGAPERSWRSGVMREANLALLNRILMSATLALCALLACWYPCHSVSRACSRASRCPSHRLSEFFSHSACIMRRHSALSPQSARDPSAVRNWESR